MRFLAFAACLLVLWAAVGPVQVAALQAEDGQDCVLPLFLNDNPVDGCVLLEPNETLSCWAGDAWSPCAPSHPGPPGDIGTASIPVVPFLGRTAMDGQECALPFVDTNTSDIVYDCLLDPTSGDQICPLLDGSVAACAPLNISNAAANTLIIQAIQTTGGQACSFPFVNG